MSFVAHAVVCCSTRCRLPRKCSFDMYNSFPLLLPCLIASLLDKYTLPTHYTLYHHLPVFLRVVSNHNIVCYTQA